VNATLGPLVVDAVDPCAVEGFRTAALGASFRPQTRAEVVKNRVHLDVYACSIEPLLELGATAPRWPYGSAGWENLIWKFVRVSDDRVVPNRWQWSVLTDPGVRVDPQGNDFVVS
jgi:hypothetical protein